MQANDRHKDLEDLIARCALKDKAALHSLYQRSASYLNGIIFRIVKNSDTSSEVLQEAFIQIWQNAAVYRADKARPLTWMTSIARYRALDRLEKENRKQQNILDNEEGTCVDQFASTTPSPEALASQNQDNQKLQYCLNQLSEGIRRCIELAYLQGYSREEIAEQQGAKVNTVKSWLHRGAKSLKECLLANSGGLA